MESIVNSSLQCSLQKWQLRVEVQNRVITHNLGYRHINCLESDTTGRQAETDVVIKPLLRRKLVDLNKGLVYDRLDKKIE